MTEEEQQEFDKQVAERVQAVRDVFTEPAQKLRPEDEPAVVYRPEAS